MGVESGTTIATLDSSWPLSGDYISQGDNHVRLLKAVLKAQFPGVGGLGFAIPITATEADINFTTGTTSNIQAQITALQAVSGIEIPVGTIMLFYQAAAPVGWTQIANDGDSMLRMVTGVGGGFGGSDSRINFTVAAHTHATSGHTLTVAEIPSHSHTQLGGGFDGNTGIESGNKRTLNYGQTGLTGGGGSHSHGDTESGGASTFTPKYVDIIQASKD